MGTYFLNPSLKNLNIILLNIGGCPPLLPFPFPALSWPNQVRFSQNFQDTFFYLKITFFGPNFFDLKKTKKKRKLFQPPPKKFFLPKKKKKKKKKIFSPPPKKIFFVPKKKKKKKKK